MLKKYFSPRDHDSDVTFGVFHIGGPVQGVLNRNISIVCFLSYI